jgi:hypothetical protein
MTSNPEVNTFKNSQRMTRSQSKRIREEEEKTEINSKRVKTEALNFKSTSAKITETPKDEDPNILNLTKQMKSSHDEIKSDIKKAKLRISKEKENHRKIIAETDRKREELWNELEVNQNAYVEKRNALWSLHRTIQNLKTRIKEVRAEEVLIVGNEVVFTPINEE